MRKISIILCISFAISSFSQDRPNKIVLNFGAGVFSNYTYDWNDAAGDWDNPKFQRGNVTYSGMLGYRSGLNSNHYKFSSTGRDKKRGNVFAIFYQAGSINPSGLSGLNKDEIKMFIQEVEGTDSDIVKFTELQVGYVWRELLRFSAGKGSVRLIENLEDLNLENVDYTVVTTGLNLRFGSICPTFNWTLMSGDNFETIMSRFDIQICMNMYFWK